MTMSAPDIKESRKSRRISRACDFCHRRGSRCRPSEEDAGVGGNCRDFGQECTYHRPAKRRGVRPKSARVENLPWSASSGTGVKGLSQQRQLSQANHEWHPPSNIRQAIVVDLIDVYFEVVYAMYASAARKPIASTTSCVAYTAT